MLKVMQRKKIIIGIMDFKDLILENCYYVDKTRLIAQVWDAGKVVLMPRPRRFGKTINLSMMRYFFEKSREGAVIDHQRLFADCMLLKEHPEYRELMGSFPVIFLTFKDVAHATWERTFESFARIIAREFVRHEYIIDSITRSVDRDLFIRISEGRASYTELTSSLFFLSQVLSKYYMRKVIFLLDEYDAPLHAGFYNNYYPEVLDFTRLLLAESLKGNDYLQRSFITGILTIAKQGMFSGLNSLFISDILDNETADSFGFTHEEVVALLEYYDMQQHLPALQSWYDGYRFGTISHMYNSWSVLNCVKKEGQLKTYWVNTGQDALIKKLLAQASGTIKSDLEVLLSGGQIEVAIKDSLVLGDLLGHYSSDSLLWSLLLYAGYLTFSSYTVTDEKTTYEVRIVNVELIRLFNELISSFFSEVVKPQSVILFLNALETGNIEMVTALLQDFILSSMSMFDISKEDNERSYHLFVLGLLVSLKDDYEVRSNRESGHGRYDVLLTPRIKGRVPIIIEFKKSFFKKDLEKSAYDALDQIKERGYVQELKDRGFDKYRAYGMAFHNKEVFVAMEP